jgi:hypothetical protein
MLHFYSFFACILFNTAFLAFLEVSGQSFGILVQFVRIGASVVFKL